MPSRSKTLPLEETRERYRALFESNMLGVATSDLKETIFEANDAFLELIGYTREDLQKGRITWSAITPERYRAIDSRKVKELLNRNAITPFEKEYIHKKGHLVPVLVGAAGVTKSPPLCVCFALDIAELKRLEHKKDEFIGTVSHELRTPLAVLKMQLGILHEQVKSGSGSAEVLQSLSELDGQVNRLTMLINDLLNLARHTGQEKVVGTAFDLQLVAQKVVKDIKLITGRAIVFHGDKTHPFVRGHEGRIVEVITNLITNAVRYSPRRSRIIVTVERGRQHARISVQDFGIGMSRSTQRKIFERGFRANHSAQYTGQSFGIGLHITREIVTAHGGTIAVKSAEGQGSTFTCTLPLYA